MVMERISLGRMAGRGGRARLAATASAFVVALLLAGCAPPAKDDTVGSIPDDYRVTHPIAYAEMLDTMDVPVGLDMVRLPAVMKGNVVGFAQRFIASGSGVLAIVVPSGSPNQRAAVSVGRQIRDQLIAAGVGAREIEFRSYNAGADEVGAPVRLAFNRMTARTEPCGPWPDDFARSPKNEHYSNYGCATQQNLAAAVENPLDLLYPRGTTPADAGRRSAVLGKYRKGTPYQSDYSMESGGNVATGVGQQ
jgi:pilus assembly protein CpaD